MKRDSFGNRHGRGAARDAYVYGVHAVQAWLASHPERLKAIHITMAGGGRAAALRAAAASAGIAVHGEDTAKLTVLAGTAHHQGVVAAVRPFPYAELAAVRTQHASLLLALDQLQDPQNFGAILRTAAAAGVDGVLIPKDGAVGVTAAVEAAAAGAAASIPVVRVTNLARSLEDLKTDGFWSAALMPAGGVELYRFDAPDRLVIVLGGEAGLRPLVAQRCDFTLSIPMLGRTQSLNASVAAAVTLYEMVRRRRGQLTGQTT